MEPGWPFAPAKIDFREGRIEAFSDWLTAPENPMFARVAVNRLWQWHFGEGLQKNSSDFGTLGGTPSQPAAARLAGVRVRRAQVQHEGDAPADGDLGHLQAGLGSRSGRDGRPTSKPTRRTRISGTIRLQRLEAEPIWDSILSAAGNLDLTVGGPSFSIGSGGGRGGGGRGMAPAGARRTGAALHDRAASRPTPT